MISASREVTDTTAEPGARTKLSPESEMVLNGTELERAGARDHPVRLLKSDINERQFSSPPGAVLRCI